MNCNCKHEIVCEHHYKIKRAIDGIIELTIDCNNVDDQNWEKVNSVIQEICRHREPKYNEVKR